MKHLNVTQGENPTSAQKGENVNGSEKKEYVFFIDKIKFETEQSHLTVREILIDFAKVSTATNTLAVKEQGNFRELVNLDESIELKEGLHFTVFNNDITQVSCALQYKGFWYIR